MGTWGTGIFSDDAAVDVRDEWREALMDDLDPEQATERVLDRCAEIANEDEATVFWLALAAAQAETGRLLPHVRDRALAIIETGDDLARWADDDPSLTRVRGKVLERLEQKLRGPQRTPTKLRRPRARPAGMDIGDVILIRNDDEGGQALFVVVEHCESWPPGSFDPVLATLLWTDKTLPTKEEMEHLPLLLDENGPEPDLLLHVVQNPTRGKYAFGPQFGEVVETGVRRPELKRKLKRLGPLFGSHCGWLYLVGWVTGTEEWGFSHAVEVTRTHRGVRR